MSKPFVRLMLREEGHMWNAYLGDPPDVDRRPLLIGSIALAIIAGHPERREAFRRLMVDSMAEIIEAVTGHAPLSCHEEAAQ